MVSKEIHILNGDSLKDRLLDLDEEVIVMRECMVDGDVGGNSLPEIFESRKEFFKNKYEVSNQGYTNKVIKEISKIIDVEEGSIINLWFENDLFCQVNFWFVLHLLKGLDKNLELFLVSPTVDSWMGFGAMSNSELQKARLKRKLISHDDLQNISQLWVAYQSSDWSNLKEKSRNLSLQIEKLESVVDAHVDRFPDNGSLGRPQRSLLKIVSEMKNPSFGSVFKVFCEREGIYGFGDLQVEHMIKELKLPVVHPNSK